MDTITTVSEAGRGRVSAGEVELWVEQRGTGPDVLLIAGLSDPAEAWEFQLAGLAGDHRLTAFDNRGAGRSPMPPDGFTVRDMADDAAALLRSLGVAHAHIVGLGSFPEAVSRTAGRRRAWFDAYATTSVTRVVNQIADLERVAEIPRLLRMLAVRSAEELNVAKLASEFGWSSRTIDAYLAQLSSAFVVQLLPAWSVNLSSKVVHRPKIHLIDSGLAAALCGHTAERLLEHA